MKKAPCLVGTGLLMKDGRGNWRSFEPLTEGIAPFLAVFLQPSQPNFLTPPLLTAVPA